MVAARTVTLQWILDDLVLTGSWQDALTSDFDCDYDTKFEIITKYYNNITPCTLTTKLVDDLAAASGWFSGNLVMQRSEGSYVV